MSTVIRVQASWAATSTLPEDASINVWHFQCLTGDVDSVVTPINVALDTFYTSIAELYNENTLTGIVTYKFYDLKDAAPRTPIAVNVLPAITIDDADALPTECAITMSFEGVLASGTIRARRRGRVYLGPLTIGPASTESGRVVVSILARDLIAGAANELIAAGNLDWRWCVFSPTIAGTAPWSEATLGLASIPVDHGWIDDAFDTQRRRGNHPSSRTTFDGTV